MWQDLGRAAPQGARRNIFNVQYAHPSINAAHGPHSRLSRPSKIKDGGRHMTSCPCVFPPLLTAPGSCHPDANLPVFITCWKERHVTGRASWRVTGLINPAWQLPDALSGSSPPSLSRTCIPVSRGVRHKRDLQVRQWRQLRGNSCFIHTSLLLKQFVSFSLLSTYLSSLQRRNCRDVWSPGPRRRKRLKCFCV